MPRQWFYFWEMILVSFTNQGCIFDISNTNQLYCNTPKKMIFIQEENYWGELFVDTLGIPLNHESNMTAISSVKLVVQKLQFSTQLQWKLLAVFAILVLGRLHRSWRNNWCQIIYSRRGGKSSSKSEPAYCICILTFTLSYFDRVFSNPWSSLYERSTEHRTVRALESSEHIYST